MNYRFDRIYLIMFVISAMLFIIMMIELCEPFEDIEKGGRVETMEEYVRRKERVNK